MKTRAARISKWLRRFAQDRIAGLSDNVRSGEKRRKYTSLTEQRILKRSMSRRLPATAAGMGGCWPSIWAM